MSDRLMVDFLNHESTNRLSMMSLLRANFIVFFDAMIKSSCGLQFNRIP